MLIELKWLDGNTSKNHSTEIYRSQLPFQDISEANLIATVGSGITTYSDDDVIQGDIYYYRFRTIKGNLKSKLSKLFEFKASQYTGPGPQRTIFGDEHFGYYGAFPDDPKVVPTINRVRSLLGIKTLPEEDVSVATYKFAIGGSVRGIHTAPIANGSEIERTNPNLKILLDGGSIEITMGLHTWAIIIPSTIHSHNPDHRIEHFPGELRSMLGVVTEMYSRVEDALTGNNTGNRILPNMGQVEFYSQLVKRFGTSSGWIISSDWDEDSAMAIDWTGPTGPPPLRPKELHIADVSFANNNNWDTTIIWPVLIYTGLKGPVEETI